MQKSVPPTLCPCRSFNSNTLLHRSHSECTSLCGFELDDDETLAKQQKQPHSEVYIRLCMMIEMDHRVLLLVQNGSTDPKLNSSNYLVQIAFMYLNPI